MSMCPFIQAFVEKNTLIPTGYNTDGKTHTQYEKISHVLSVFFNSGTSFATTSIPFTLYARFQTSEQSLCGHKDPIVHLTCNNQSNTCFPYIILGSHHSDWFLRWFSEQVSKSRLRANVAPPYSQNSYKSQMCLNDQWQTIQKQRLQSHI